MAKKNKIRNQTCNLTFEPRTPNKQKLNDLQRKHVTWNRKYATIL